MMERHETNEIGLAGLPRVVENPVTGERLTFLVTAGETNGEYVRVRCELPPGCPGNAMHYHLGFTESFEGVEGRLDMCVGGERKHIALTKGETVFVPRKLPHRFWNSSDEPVVFEAEIRPGRSFEKAIRTACGMAQDGKLNDKGVPKNVFELALMFEISESYMTGLPLFLQRAIFGTIAKVARLRGYDPKFSEYTKPKGG